MSVGSQDGIIYIEIPYSFRLITRFETKPVVFELYKATPTAQIEHYGELFRHNNTTSRKMKIQGMRKVP